MGAVTHPISETFRLQSSASPSVAGLAILLAFFFFYDTATTEIYTPLYTLSLHDALPISQLTEQLQHLLDARELHAVDRAHPIRSEEHTSELQSHSGISYAVFCLKKK